MEKLVQSLTSGLLTGSVYGLMALGLTLIWGALRLLNLAHGAMYLAGAYLAWTFGTAAGLPLPLAFALAVVGAGALGLLVHMVVVAPLVGRPGWDNAALVATVGVSMAIESAVLLVFSPATKKIPPLVDGQLGVGGVVMSWHGLAVIGVALSCLVGMNLFLQRSRHGLAIRAVAQDQDAARLQGIPVARVYATVTTLSAALAGMAGVLLSSIYYLSPASGFDPMIKALVVTIFGGLGSVRGTLWAAYIVGLGEAFVTVYLGASFALPGLFLFMIVMLVVRPYGLAGVRELRRL